MGPLAIPQNHVIHRCIIMPYKRDRTWSSEPLSEKSFTCWFIQSEIQYSMENHCQLLILLANFSVFTVNWYLISPNKSMIFNGFDILIEFQCSNKCGTWLIKIIYILFLNLWEKIHMLATTAIPRSKNHFHLHMDIKYRSW